MLKQLSSSIIGILILSTLLLIGINIVFSYLYFEYKGINTASLDLLNNVITPKELRKINILGYFLLPKEISHLKDVVDLIIMSRIALLIMIPFSVILLFKWKTMRIKIIVRSWYWVAFIGSCISISYKIGGAKLISGYIHPVLFPQGNWMFNSQSLIRRIYNAHVIEHGAIFVMSFVIVSLAVLTILVLWKNKMDAKYS